MGYRPRDIRRGSTPSWVLFMLVVAACGIAMFRWSLLLHSTSITTLHARWSSLAALYHNDGTCSVSRSSSRSWWWCWSPNRQEHGTASTRHPLDLHFGTGMDNNNGSHGITFKYYDNMGLAGTPSFTTILNTTSFSIPLTLLLRLTPEHKTTTTTTTPTKQATPFSAELYGSLVVPPQGATYQFFCSWLGSSMGFVWVDGHMVCQDGNTYQTNADDMDDALPMNNNNNIRDGHHKSGSSRGIVKQLPFRAHFYFNGTLRPKDIVRRTKIGLSVEWSVRPTTTTATGRSDTDTGGESAIVPIPTTLLHPWLKESEARRDTLQRQLASSGWGPWLHSSMLSLVLLPDAATITTKICHVNSTNTNTTTENNNNCIEYAFPDGAQRRVPHSDVPGPKTRVGHHAYDRSYVQFYVGPSSTLPVNVSIEYSVHSNNNDNNNKSEFDMIITPIHCGDDDDDGEDCRNYVVILECRYAWFKAGTVQRQGDNIAFSPAGRPPFTVYTSSSSSSTFNQQEAQGLDLPDRNKNDDDDDDSPSMAHIALPLGSGPIGISTTPYHTKNSVTQIVKMLDHARANEERLLLDTFGGSVDRAAEGQAIQASVMWNLIATPAENGGAPLLPVSRAWNLAPPVSSNDFTYMIFDWDNFFASLLMSNGAATSTKNTTTSSLSSIQQQDCNDLQFAFAISNLFQVVKSKTAAGFIPNLAGGGKKTQDRSEPPIGAKVTLVLVEKFGPSRTQWVVDVVFDDLLDWNDWFLRKRIKPPLDMIALGAYNDRSHKVGITQYARFESGLDNSPMYDDATLNITNGCHWHESGCGLMEEYDVGMTAMFVQEAYALAKLAAIIGRPQSLIAMLQQRGDEMARKIRTHLWDEEQGVFVNRYTTAGQNTNSSSAVGSFSARVSPTSFYALLADAATDEQAERMTKEWLLNASRFCISPNGDYTGNSDDCFWGLPSIAASDPAYPPLGYWRGFIWGPMAQLTYWSLLNYDHLEIVRLARKSLCRQMAGLMMSQWTANRHICENYNPHREADTTGGDCSGTRFYHWGALTGLIGHMEDGIF
jgi:Trehalase